MSTTDTDDLATLFEDSEVLETLFLEDGSFNLEAILNTIRQTKDKDIDEAKIRHLSETIKKGDYKIDSDAIAKAILEEM